MQLKQTVNGDEMKSDDMINECNEVLSYSRCISFCDKNSSTRRAWNYYLRENEMESAIYFYESTLEFFNF